MLKGIDSLIEAVKVDEAALELEERRMLTKMGNENIQNVHHEYLNHEARNLNIHDIAPAHSSAFEYHHGHFPIHHDYVSSHHSYQHYNEHIYDIPDPMEAYDTRASIANSNINDLKYAYEQPISVARSRGARSNPNAQAREQSPIAKSEDGCDGDKRKHFLERNRVAGIL
jgi:hypothetical protein